MDKEILSNVRAEVIEKFINIEWIINAIISQHYFKRVYLPFLTEVLYDEYCSFALKRRIFEKIVPNIDGQQIQKLNRLNTIRNYFAHCGQEIFDGPSPPRKGQKGWVPDPRRPNIPVNFENLHKEFTELESSVSKYLLEVFQKLGGIATKGEE